MLFPENYAEASEAAQSALQVMKRKRIPANPKNFTIWYAYHTGYSPDLCKTLDILLSSGDFSEARNEEIYETFFGDKIATDEVDKASDEISNIISRMVDAIGEAGQNATEYGEHLKSFTGHIDKVTNNEDLKTLVNGILLETRRMEKRNRDLESQLSSSTQTVQDLSRRLEDVKREAMTDALTGVANRKCFDLRLTQCVQEARDSDLPLCLLMIDIDHFKKFNDTYGHPMGDQVLKLIGRMLAESVKGRDTPARYGGEEFAVILPVTRIDDAVTLAEQVRQAVADRKVKKRSTGETLAQITLSVGVAELRSEDSISEFLIRADDALYEAKRAGRNQVVTEREAAAISATG